MIGWIIGIGALMLFIKSPKNSEKELIYIEKDKKKLQKYFIEGFWMSTFPVFGSKYIMVSSDKVAKKIAKEIFRYRVTLVSKITKNGEKIIYFEPRDKSGYGW